MLNFVEGILSSWIMRVVIIPNILGNSRLSSGEEGAKELGVSYLEFPNHLVVRTLVLITSHLCELPFVKHHHPTILGPDCSR